MDDLGFDYRVAKDGPVLICRAGRLVATVGGARARTLAAKLAAAGPAERQQLLARASGNYARGNERPAGAKSRRGGGR